MPQSRIRIAVMAALSSVATALDLQVDGSSEALFWGAGGVRLAYIDPGSGSLVIQALVGAAAAVIVTTRLYWKKIKGWFGGATAEADDDGDLVGSRESTRKTDD